MSQGLVERQYLQDIGDAIRSKNGSSDTYTPAEMAQAISGIRTADEVVLVQKTVNANGQYNPSDDSADGYSGVLVNVPNSYSASDEGKVVSNGTLVAQATKQITANGTHDTTTNNSVSVDVPNSYATSDNGKVVVDQALVAQTSKNINANGTHDTTANNSVVVDVPNSYSAADEGKVVSGGALVGQTSRNITANGAYDTTGNNEVVVNVSGGGGIELLTRSAWNSLTTTQKQAKGLVAIQDSSTGFKQGVLVNGAYYLLFNAIRIWTKSTGGMDAALYIQRGNYTNGTFVSYDEVYSILYTDVRSSPIEYYSAISIQYSNQWIVKATANVEYDSISYAAGDTVNTWTYNKSVDFVVLADVED